MPKKSDIPAVTIGRYCPICGKHYVLPHPKDYTKPFCDECMGILKEIVNERRQNDGRKKAESCER